MAWKKVEELTGLPVLSPIREWTLSSNTVVGRTFVSLGDSHEDHTYLPVAALAVKTASQIDEGREVHSDWRRLDRSI